MSLLMLGAQMNTPFFYAILLIIPLCLMTSSLDVEEKRNSTPLDLSRIYFAVYSSSSPNEDGCFFL